MELLRHLKIVIGDELLMTPLSAACQRLKFTWSAKFCIEHERTGLKEMGLWKAHGKAISLG